MYLTVLIQAVKMKPMQNIPIQRFIIRSPKVYRISINQIDCKKQKQDNNNNTIFIISPN